MGGGGRVFSKGSATQEKLLQSVDTTAHPCGALGVSSIFFLFTCTHLVVSQSGFSREITHFFKESSHTIMKVSLKTNKHFGKSPKKQTNRSSASAVDQQDSGRS